MCWTPLYANKHKQVIILIDKHNYFLFLIKTYISNLVSTTRFWGNLHQVIL